ncbi:ATP-binding SpoIIE family protein phosphatase [Halopseudomonas salegens]|uniref:Histidine kinase-like ATPase domain-containing protein n=1 Tax=Halopseudomonas salegens TaxID=1434072 RepID=A0A1H2G3S4_9GAMM|nr:fused response regulator/phosphatase [Halopseudomonas salegens]SDU14179.1 Histidine kinase-like ATPase domain-containing protein [Halopseudomonas salegens]
MAAAVPSGAEPPAGLRILVADDNPADRLILSRLVSRQGHEVLAAENGADAVEQFLRERPQLILLDAMMPVMDGFAAAQLIREAAGEDLVPIIFLTSLTETHALVRCLEAGGDDFLTKPYNPVILQAKIQAFQRMQEMHHTLQQQRDLISRQHERMVHDQELAKRIFDRVAHAGALDAPNVRYLQSAYAMFNGDVLLAAQCPAGGMHVLLADFTGHGLSAAIGAMPLAEVFYAMSARGFALQDILAELNDKLERILPVGVFCCALLAEINPLKHKLEVWNGGLPDAVLLDVDGSVQHWLPSTHLPLGVVPNDRFDVSTLTLPMSAGQRLLCWTDGIIETRNAQGQQFGDQGVAKVLAAGSGQPEQLFDHLLSAIKDFHGRKDDDLSLLQVSMPTDVLPRSPAMRFRSQREMHDWRLEHVFRAQAIRTQNPLPWLLDELLRVPGLRDHAGTLATVLSELFSNALEHGLLALDSSLKSTAEGFNRYYLQRSQRLQQLEEGWIRVMLDHTQEPSGGRLLIEVQDSGQGFVTAKTGTVIADSFRYAGRGLTLVAALTDEMQVLPDGRGVQVRLAWHAP